MKDSQHTKSHTKNNTTYSSKNRGNVAAFDALLFLGDNLLLRVLEELKDEDLPLFNAILEKQSVSEEENEGEIVAFLRSHIKDFDVIMNQEAEAFMKRSGTQMAAALFVEKKE